MRDVGQTERGIPKPPPSNYAPLVCEEAEKGTRQRSLNAQNAAGALAMWIMPSIQSAQTGLTFDFMVSATEGIVAKGNDTYSLVTSKRGVRWA